MSKLKRVLSFGLALCMAAVGMPFSSDDMASVLPLNELSVSAASEAQSGICGVNLTWEYDGNGTLTISGTGEMMDFGGPSYVRWHSLASEIKNVKIADGVTSIGSYAFYACNSVTSITLPDSVTSIGADAFGYCTSLTSINIPDGVTSIESQTFEGCRSLKSITIPDSVTYIDYNAFAYCGGLTSVTIPDSVKIIGVSAFYACSGLASVIIPDNGISIGGRAFYGCSNLISVVIPESVESIKSDTFRECRSLASISIQNADCEIDDSSTTISDTATIYGYTNSTAQAYAEKYDRTFIALDGNESTTSGTCGDNITWEYDGDSTLTISGKGDMFNYSSTDDVPWYDFRSEIENVIISDGVTSIGWYAFFGCSKLYSVTIPNSVTNIESYTFYDCPNLDSITIPSKVTKIGNEAFEFCEGLRTITIPDSVVSIGSGIFRGCTSLTQVNISDSITTISSSAFNGCSSLKSVTLPDSVISIESSAFDGCSSLKSVIIPDCVTSIGVRAFGGCSSLTSISIRNPDCEIYDVSTTISDTATIYGYTRSTAQTYAEKYDRTFVALDAEPEETTTTIPETTTTTNTKATTTTIATTTSTSTNATTTSATIISTTSTSTTLATTSITTMPTTSTSTTATTSTTTIPTTSSSATTTTTTTTMPITTTDSTTTSSTVLTKEALALGDVNGDDNIDASDAAEILVEAARRGAGYESEFTDAQITAADVNEDGAIDASDAAVVLVYAATVGAGSFTGTLRDFLQASKEYDEDNVGEIYYSPIDPEHIAEDENGIMYADNEILVVASEGIYFDSIQSLAKEYGAEIVGYIEQTGDYQWKFDGVMTESELNTLIVELKNNKLVADACLNGISVVSENAIPESESVIYGSQWSADLVNSTDNEGLSWGVEAINAPAAWDYLDSHKSEINPIKVGLIDYGFDNSNEDLAFAEIFYDNNENGTDVSYDYPGNFHGMHVAGTMAATGTNSEGINGVYPYGAGRIYGVSYVGINKHKVNSKATYENYVSMMCWKIGYSELILRNVKVINTSLGFNLGFDDLSQLNDDSEEYKMYSQMANQLGSFLDRLIDLDYDFVLVTSAGNDSNQGNNLESKYNSFVCMIGTDYEVYDRIIVVGSVGTGDWQRDSNGSVITDNSSFHRPTFVFNSRYSISDFSNAGERVDIFAPGEFIYSTVPDFNFDSSNRNHDIINEQRYQNWFRYNEYQKDNNGNYVYDDQGERVKITYFSKWSGTSMAAPHVAGVCANVWSINNDLTGAQVKEIVCNSNITDADDEKIVAYTYDDFDGNSQDKYIVDCAKAVEKAAEEKGIGDNPQKEYGSVLGWVVEQNADGSAANENNIKIPNATITVYTNSAEHERISIDGVDEWTTDEFGHYEIMLPEGNYLIEASKEGYEEYGAMYSVAAKVYSQQVTYAKWIELKIKDDEKYARIVMENEDIWLDELELDNAANSIECWFEDLDFDGKPEFVVGPTKIIDGYGFIYCYNIYKFTDSQTMIKMAPGHLSYDEDSSMSVMPMYYSTNMYLNLYKDMNNEYHYVYVMDSESDLFPIYEVDFGGNVIRFSELYNLPLNEDWDISYMISGEEVGYEDMLQAIRTETANDVLCRSNIETISLTNSYGEIEDDCYSNLSEADRKDLLLDSYNAYSITETSETPEFYEKLLEQLEREETEPDHSDSDNIVYLEDMPIISVERYDGDRGENFIEKIGTNAVSRGNTDINGNSYTHGLEGWIGRWNYKDVQGWVETTFEINDSYQFLTGYCVLIQSYNVTNFDTTLYFYGDDKLIKSYHMTPDTIPFDISVDVTGVKNLKLAIYDNIAVPGGTSFGLIDMILSPDSTKTESNDAEKFAQIVMDNENVWLEPFNNGDTPIYGGTVDCWFEDIDFDGTPEFIVGGCNMGTQGGISYNIYRIENGEMIGINLSDDFPYNSTGDIPIFLQRPNSGFNEYSAEIIKDKDGKYRYIFPYILSYLGSGYGIAEMKINGDTLDWELIGGYITEPEMEYRDNSNSSVSKQNLISSMDSWFERSTLCWSEIGTIPCTYVCEYLDQEWFEAASNSDVGLSDASASYVSGCYDTLNDVQKKEALIKSYNTYTIMELGWDSELYAQMLQDMSEDAWKTSYIRYAEEYVLSDEAFRDSASFYLIDINEDGIPELHIQSGFGYGGSRLLLYDYDYGIKELIMGNGSGIRLIKGENIFNYYSMHQGLNTDDIFTIEDNEFKQLASGYSLTGYADESLYQYFWNDEPMSQSEYQTELDNIFDSSIADSYYYFTTGYSFYEIYDAIISY